ncbi:MAG: SDR family oxidoreductase [Sandaracinaceae bacterium]|nr:SDR family oxidoreductase [Sandaracinaceae bacterium]
MNDLCGKAVLVTGGTAGIGLATALRFAEAGAACTLTYRFGTADEDEVRAAFAARGAPPPLIVQADASRDDDTDALLEEMRARHDAVEVFVSNVSGALVTHSFEDYDRRGLMKSIGVSAWPMVAYTRKIRAVFGRYPRYVIGMSSTGPDHFSVGYDFVAASKSVMETLCRYMSYRLFDRDCRVNVIRSRSIRTEAFESTFGKDFYDFAMRLSREEHFLVPDDVAKVAFALANGSMDAVSGQVITVDKGTTFFDDLMRLWHERDALGLSR